MSSIVKQVAGQSRGLGEMGGRRWDVRRGIMSEKRPRSAKQTKRVPECVRKVQFSHLVRFFPRDESEMGVWDSNGARVLRLQIDRPRYIN